jgi:hypothetical protein
VANSKRGRELRAQAALARFGAAKTEPVKDEPGIKDEPYIKQEPEDSETDSDWDDAEFGGEQRSGEAGDMIKVCGDEGDEEDGHNEMDELRKMSQKAPPAGRKDRPNLQQTTTTATSSHDHNPPKADHVDSETESESEQEVLEVGPVLTQTSPSVPPVSAPAVTSAPKPSTEVFEPQQPAAEPSIPTVQPGACPICSLANDASSPTCMACSNVLQPSLMPDHWRCKSETCKDSSYINAGDAGLCGICGGQKPKYSGGGAAGSRSGAGGTRPVGVIEGDVLRWD